MILEAPSECVYEFGFKISKDKVAGLERWWTFVVIFQCQSEFFIFHFKVFISSS